MTPIKEVNICKYLQPGQQENEGKKIRRNLSSTKKQSRLN